MDISTGKKRPTIEDVARLAGLSIATVSRYINGAAAVSLERAGRIQAAIEALHYTPRQAAQVLARQATRTIGLLILMVSGDFFAPMLRGVEKRALEEGYSLLIHSTGLESQSSLQAQRVLGEHNTDGLIVFSISLNDGELRRLHEGRFPVVLLHHSGPKDLHIPFVTVENKDGVRSLIDHLIEAHSCRRIVHLRGPEQHDDTCWREMGYCQSKEHKL